MAAALQLSAPKNGTLNVNGTGFDSITNHGVLSTALTGTNNDLDFTGKLYGLASNAISVTYVDPGGATAVLGVTVSGTDITVNLGRAASAINSTAALVKAAVEAVAAAAALVTVTNKAGNDGTGLVTAMAKTNLSSGTDAASVKLEIGMGALEYKHTVTTDGDGTFEYDTGIELRRGEHVQVSAIVGSTLQTSEVLRTYTYG